MGRTSTVNKATLATFCADRNVSKCLKCGREIKGNSMGNIKRHYRTIHKVQFAENGNKMLASVTNLNGDDFITITLNKPDFLKHCVGETMRSAYKQRNVQSTYQRQQKTILDKSQKRPLQLDDDQQVTWGFESDNNAEIAKQPSTDSTEELVYIKEEPALDVEDPIESKSPNSATASERNSIGGERPDEEADSEEHDDEYSDSDDYHGPPDGKRRCSESDSQSHHSQKLNCQLPKMVSIADALVTPNPTPAISGQHQRNTFRGFPTPTYITQNVAQPRHLNGSFSSYVANSPQSTAASTFRQSTNAVPTTVPPCKITIKKIMQPSPVVNFATAKLTPQSSSTMTQQVQPVNTTTGLTGLSYSSVQQTFPSAAMLNAVHKPTAEKMGVRDSYDLFFDSICATVKALPPRLATEGKMRIMQLVGDLEMRAIAQREGTTGQSATNAFASVNANGTAGPAASGNHEAACHESGTVASTTK